MSPAERRNRTIAAQAELIARGEHAGPVIVAGVTGSVPATSRLIATVARKPNGAVVLPGLDTELDDAAFRTVRPTGQHTDGAHPEHPQFGFARLLADLGLARGDVRMLPGSEVSAPLQARASIVTEAMRPAATTSAWRAFAEIVDAKSLRDALDGCSLIAAPTTQDEAEVVALILRETLETPGKTAALVSPDRLLARRVATRLEGWGIAVDDSAGRPFRKTPVGAFLDLILECIETDFAPVPVTALLKHPLTRLCLPRGDIRRHARNFELAVFRQPYLGRGIEDLTASFEKRRAETAGGHEAHRQFVIRPVRQMKDADWDGAAAMIAAFTSAFAPLTTLQARAEDVPLANLAAALADTATVLATSEPADLERNPGTGTSRPWQGEDGETAAEIFARLMLPDRTAPAMAAADLPSVFRALTANENVRTRRAVHPRLSIWGPFEARLQRPDVVILGSLNEGTWPEVPDTGPWLNRPMRRDLGLPQPEEATGYAAHDVSQLLGADQVYLTRAEKVDGTPTVPSRWLMRLQAVLAGTNADGNLPPKRPWLSWAAAPTAVTSRAPVSQPLPCPPLHLRPDRLSVSDVGTWVMNPYALYAKKILGLNQLDPLGKAPDAALRGSIVHAALADFAEAFPDALPANIAAALIAIGEQRLEEFIKQPDVAAFWAPRFRRFARWFAETEPDRRGDGYVGFSEVTGQIDIAGKTGRLTLTARADRIDLSAGGVAIYDYKGARELATMARNARDLRAPQLPLEAAIATDGGFAGVNGDVIRLAYISTSGGEPAGSEVPLVSKGSVDYATLATEALDDLRALVDRFAK
ncbi:MAG: double-strand break repair protein AddB, partial [Pseudomonadota bacterium]